MRLKPMLTWRILAREGVFVEPRLVLAVADAARGERRLARGWLIRRATAAEPSSVAMMAIPTHSSQVDGASGRRRCGSVSKASRRPSRSKPTYRPSLR